MAKQLSAGDKVNAKINSIYGRYPAVVVRDRTDDPDAMRGLRLDGESVYEVRYLAGPYKGSHADFCARDLVA